MRVSMFQLPLARARYYPGCPGAGTRPSCCRKPRVSPCCQFSRNFPPVKREMVMPGYIPLIPDLLNGTTNECLVVFSGHAMVSFLWMFTLGKRGFAGQRAWLTLLLFQRQP